jgi:60S ribosome subunit biogenesis protein NIP7
MRKAENFQKKKIMGMGVCVGKFSKGGVFRLHISALDIMAQYARVCV